MLPRGAREALVAAESEAFDPALDWVGEARVAKFLVAQRVVHILQPESALQAVRVALEAFECALALAGLQVMTNLTGSTLLALAVAHGRASAKKARRVAHVAEDFQIAQRGEDEEASARRAARWRDFERAARVVEGTLGRDGPLSVIFADGRGA